MNTLFRNLCRAIFVFLIAVTIVCAGASNSLSGESEQLSAELLNARTFHLNFETDLSAISSGRALPLQSENVDLVPGLRGKGCLIPPEGILDYETENNLSIEEGSLSIWFKLNWTPVGRGSWRDNIKLAKELGVGFADVLWPLFTVGDELVVRMFTRILYTCDSRNPEIVVSMINSRMIAGKWEHLVLTWGPRSRKIYLNGELMGEATRDGKGKGHSGNMALSHDRSRFTFGKVGKRDNAADTVMDEISVFNREITKTEVRSLYTQIFPVTVCPYDFAGNAGRKNEFRVRLLNLQKKPVKTDIYLSVSTKDNKKVLMKSSLKVSLDSEEMNEKEKFVFTPPAPGDYVVSAYVGGRLVKSWEITAISERKIRDEMPLSDTGETKLKLIEEIDCTKDFPEDRYRDDEHCEVVESPVGAYRHTTLHSHESGFAYRFDVPNPGRPHWLEVEYPDDVQRIFFVAIFPYSGVDESVARADGLDSMAMITGSDHAITNRMQSKRMLFWPDSNEIIMVCYSAGFYKEDQGAALSKIRLYETEGELPRLNINTPKTLPKRQLSLWDEDPTMPAYACFNRPSNYERCDFTFWRIKLERKIQYARFQGISHWSLQLLDYSGDNSGAHRLSLPTSPAPNYHPGWADLNAALFERENLPFYIELNPLVQVQRRSKLGALTNAIGYDKIAFEFEEAEKQGADCLVQITGHNKLSGDAKKGPNLNPLHPVVRDTWQKIFSAYRDQFARYSQFSGIDLNNRVNSRNPLPNLWFENAEAGYDDYTVGLFETENGLEIPVDKKSKTRFSERYKWLKDNAWDQWLDWRCIKVMEVHKELVETLNTGLSGKKLIARLVMPPKQNATLVGLAKGEPKKSLAELWRERGIDFTLMSDVKNLVVMPLICPNASRTNPNHPIDERYYTFSPEFADLLADEPAPAVLLYIHSIIEMWGGSPRAISKIKSFWQGIKQQRCYSTPQPANKYTLEHLAWVLAETDPSVLFHGFWGCPENGAHELYQQFYKAYLSLPAVKFTKVNGINDPVVVRTYEANGQHWLYVVNKAYYPVKMKFSLGAANANVTDVINNRRMNLKTVGKRAIVEKELHGFEVLAMNCPADLDLGEISVKVPNSIKSDIASRLKKWKTILADTTKKTGKTPQAAAAIVEAASRYFEAGEYTRADYRLQSRELYKLTK